MDEPVHEPETGRTPDRPQTTNRHIVNTAVLTKVELHWHASPMSRASKTTQLQIRVSKTEKSALKRAASRSGLDLSAYVLGRVNSRPHEEFQLAVRVVGQGDARFALAELNTLLSGFTTAELREAVAHGLPTTLSPYLANYIAAMVEMACARRQVELPPWVQAVPPLPEAAFGSTLQSLRLHLLTHSPAPFRRRNIFIDASIDDRV
jgi:hypothetical protein